MRRWIQNVDGCGPSDYFFASWANLGLLTYLGCHIREPNPNRHLLQRRRGVRRRRRGRRRAGDPRPRSSTGGRLLDTEQLFRRGGEKTRSGPYSSPRRSSPCRSRASRFATCLLLLMCSFRRTPCLRARFLLLWVH